MRTSPQEAHDNMRQCEAQCSVPQVRSLLAVMRLLLSVLRPMGAARLGGPRPIALPGLVSPALGAGSALPPACASLGCSSRGDLVTGTARTVAVAEAIGITAAAAETVALCESSTPRLHSPTPSGRLRVALLTFELNRCGCVDAPVVSSCTRLCDGVASAM